MRNILNDKKIPADLHSLLDYTVDWSQWLGTGETISSVDWTVPEGVVLDDSTNNGTTATAWLKFDAAGHYTVGCRITTSDDRIDERSFVVMVYDR